MRELPQTITEAFVTAVDEALAGLERVTIPAAELFLALSGDGAPCSPDAFRQRFAQFLTSKMAGHETSRVRISLDW